MGRGVSCRIPRKMERQINRMMSVDLRLKNYTAQWSIGLRGGGGGGGGVPGGNLIKIL